MTNDRKEIHQQYVFTAGHMFKDKAAFKGSASFRQFLLYAIASLQLSLQIRHFEIKKGKMKLKSRNQGYNPINPELNP